MLGNNGLLYLFYTKVNVSDPMEIPGLEPISPDKSGSGHVKEHQRDPATRRTHFKVIRYLFEAGKIKKKLTLIETSIL